MDQLIDYAKVQNLTSLKWGYAWYNLQEGIQIWNKLTFKILKMQLFPWINADAS